MTTASTLPPTHIIDAPGTYIAPSDPAWDHPRIEAELALLKKPPDEESKPADDAGRHPLIRYFAGYTRFQPDAAEWAPDGKPCTVREYLRPEATPATFQFVRPNRRRLRQVAAIDDTWERREAYIRAVVRRIDGPADALRWSPAAEVDEVPEAALEALYQWNPALVRQLADAAAAYCAPLREHEGKR